jgi:hypothetical protein
MRKEPQAAGNLEDQRPPEIKERCIHPNRNRDSGQITLDAASVLVSESEFQAAVRNFFSARGEVEIEAAIDELHRSRGILVMDHGFTLEQLCALVDEMP